MITGDWFLRDLETFTKCEEKDWLPTSAFSLSGYCICPIIGDHMWLVGSYADQIEGTVLGIKIWVPDKQGIRLNGMSF
jgi:hypothetical protein